MKYSPPGPDCPALRAAGASINCVGASYADALDKWVLEAVRNLDDLDSFDDVEQQIAETLADVADPDSAIREVVGPLLAERQPRDTILAAAYRRALEFRSFCTCGLTPERIEEVVALAAKEARHGTR